MATLAHLAQLVGGEIVGDGNLELSGAATLHDALSGQITLLDKSEKADQLHRTQASAAVVPADFPTANLHCPVILASDPHRAFTQIVSHFRPPRVQPRTGRSPLAVISPSAKLAADVDVHPYAIVGDDVEIGAGSTIHAGAHVMAGCKLGECVTIFPHAVLYENTELGNRVIVHAGAVLGCYGFGYKVVGGRHQISAQLGNVIVGDDVEIGAASTIDRGTYGPTVIGEGTKIDNQVMIAHNCRIGKHNLICSQVGIAGSSNTGDYVVLAGRVGVRDHVHIGDQAVLGAMSGVSHDVPAGAHMLGIPATPEREQKLRLATLAKLPEMRQQLKALQHAVDELRGIDRPDKRAA